MTRLQKPDPTSRRSTPLPADWKTKTRPRILTRDGHRCTWIRGLRDGGHWTMTDHPHRCTSPATDVDHMGAPDDHRDEVLRALCGPHHAHRTGQQAAAARHARRQPRNRPQQTHPGLRPGVGG